MVLEHVVKLNTSTEMPVLGFGAPSALASRAPRYRRHSAMKNILINLIHTDG